MLLCIRSSSCCFATVVRRKSTCVRECLCSTPLLGSGQIVSFAVSLPQLKLALCAQRLNDDDQLQSRKTDPIFSILTFLTRIRSCSRVVRASSSALLRKATAYTTLRRHPSPLASPPRSCPLPYTLLMSRGAMPYHNHAARHALYCGGTCWPALVCSPATDTKTPTRLRRIILQPVQ